MLMCDIQQCQIFITVAGIAELFHVYVCQGSSYEQILRSIDYGPRVNDQEMNSVFWKDFGRLKSK